MEDLIPLLIIVASGIISLFASTRKQKRNNQSSGSFQGDETAIVDQEEETQHVEKQQESFGEESIEQRKQQILGKEESPADTGRQPEEEKPQVEHLSKPRRNRTKKRAGEKSSIEAIKEKFDVEEAIIYSEIINRKYF